MKNLGISARAKIEATVAGARTFCEMSDRGENFADVCWAFSDHGCDGKWAIVPHADRTLRAISKELKRRGFKFVGPTIGYAWMQAVGIVNDHSLGCFRRDQVARRA